MCGKNGEGNNPQVNEWIFHDILNLKMILMQRQLSYGSGGWTKGFLDWIMGMWVRKRIGFISLLQLFSYICRINSLNSLIIMENENKNQLQIELKEEVAQGTYANLAIYA